MLACGKKEIVKCLYVCKEAKQKEEAMTLEIGQDKDDKVWGIKNEAHLKTGY